MLVLKLTLVPLFVLVVSMSGKWWGPSIAGWLAGLPVVAGPILYLLTLSHGGVFGARAATLSLAAILASEGFNFAYAWTCRSRSWPVALVAGLVVWFLCACGLSFLPTSPLWASIVAVAAVSIGQAFLPITSSVAAGAPLSRFDLLGRMIAGAILTLCVTSLSAWAGPTWSGLLAVFPLLGIILSVSSQRAHGPAFVISLLRGMVLGRFSFAAFCLLLSFTLPYQRPTLAFFEAALLAMVVQWCTKRVATQVDSTGRCNTSFPIGIRVKKANETTEKVVIE